MFAVGLRMHEAASTRSPLTSTMHARQLPSVRYPGKSTWQRCGISRPSRLATSQIVSPGAAVTGFPSRVKAIRSAMSEILSEQLEQMIHGVRRGLSQAADRRVAHDGLE